MIFKSSSPLSPVVDILINGTPTDYLQAQQIVIEEEENKHTMAIIDFSGMSPDLISDYIDKPITINVSYNGSVTTEFIGYVIFLEPTSITNQGLVDNSPFQLTRLYCMGASYIMKSKKSRSWENATIADVALKIADLYKFSVAVPNDPYRFSRLTQSSQSDWSFLVEVCRKLGYSLNVYGTHLHIWDPYTLLSRDISYSVLKSIAGNYGDVTPSPGQIISFEGRIGATTPTATRAPDTLHVLDRNGILSSVSSSLSEEISGFGDYLESMFANTMSVNTDNYEMGKRLVSGELRRKFSNTAKVVVTGSPEIRPGGIVKIDKYNSKLDGYWYVTSVKHQIVKSEYISTVHIANDSTAVDVPIYNRTEVYTEPPVASLLDSTWVSSTHSVVIY